jgi:hypothetical protein
MNQEKILKEAQNIAEDIREEQGELAPFGAITLEEARQTVSTYGHEGEDLEEISKALVITMEGIL